MAAFHCFRSSAHPRGTAMFLAISMVVVLAILSLALLDLGQSSNRNSQNVTARYQALLLAQAGIADEISQMNAQGAQFPLAIGSASSPIKWGPVTNQQEGYYVTYDGSAPTIDPSGNRYFKIISYGVVSNTLVGLGGLGQAGSTTETELTDCIRAIEGYVVVKQGSPKGVFLAGAFGRKWLALGGTQAYTDSYDSRGIPVLDANGNQVLDANGQPVFSPASYYTIAAQAGYHSNPALGGMGGDVGTDGMIITSGNGNVYGNASFGPTINGVSYTLTGNWSVSGSTAAYPNTVPLPDPTPLTIPPANLTYTVVEGTTLGVTSGSTTLYRVANISGAFTVKSDTEVIIYLDGSLQFHGNSTQVTVQPGGRLTIYQAAGPGFMDTSGTPGVQILTDSTHPIAAPDQFTVVSAATGGLSFGGNSAWMGSIYAPFSDLALGGNGVKYGALVGLTVKIAGNPEFHWDKNSKSPAFRTNPATTLASMRELLVNTNVGDPNFGQAE